MIAIPIIGIPTLLWRGRGLNFGLFEIASPFARTPEIYRPLTEVHEIASYALIALVVFHVFAALYHQYVLRDDVLRRMLLPRNAAEPERPPCPKRRGGRFGVRSSGLRPARACGQ